MTIHDYIKKHGLAKWRTWPAVATKFSDSWMPAFFISADPGENFEHEERFEIYANPDHTHFVSMNMTRQLFRIVHSDLIILHSKWESMRPELNYSPLRRL